MIGAHNQNGHFGEVSKYVYKLVDAIRCDEISKEDSLLKRI
jgi:hypothetical protein